MALPPRAIDQQAVENRLHAGELRRHLLSEGLVITELLGLDAADHPLRLDNQLIELLVRTNVEVTKPLEELTKVFDDRIAKYLGFAIFVAAQPLC